ncbi:MAG: DUF2177 family protein [Pseudomonadota bacterium]|nr:DUF2177 family protein [Pseudomonadota bacterium]
MYAKIVMAYVATALVFGILDAVWLRNAGPLLYRPALGELFADKFRLAPAITFYVIFIAGLTYFAVVPGILSNAGSGMSMFAGVPLSVMHGALLGLFAYAAYDLTNQATMKVWPSHITLIDMAWGTVASGFAAGVATFVVTRFGGPV